MGVLSTNSAQISSGGLISSSFISDIYDVLTGGVSETPVFSGSLSVSGSLNVSSGITGDVTGTTTTASFVSTTLTFMQNTSLGTVVNGALAVSSSGELYFGSASVWHKVTLG